MYDGSYDSDEKIEHHPISTNTNHPPTQRPRVNNRVSYSVPRIEIGTSSYQCFNHGHHAVLTRDAQWCVVVLAGRKVSGVGTMECMFWE